MKHFLVFAFVTLTFFTRSLLGQATFERDLKQLQQQHSKDVAAAIAPVVSRHAASLEQLLRRATQAGDLKTASEITEILKTLPASSAAMTNEPVAGVIGKWKMSFGGNPPLMRELKPDGKIIREEGGDPGEWSILGMTLKIAYPNAKESVFSLPVKDGKMVGKTWNGATITAEKH